MKHKVIDNFLDEEYFNSLENLFIDKKNTVNVIMPWFFKKAVANDLVENNIFYMTHTLYELNEPQSEFYENLIPLLKKLDVKCLIRMVANFFPNTHIIHEHPMHVDFTFLHSGAILSLNTCDGYTKLKNGIKIDSIANRLLKFDSSEEHCSTTTTNIHARINIVINYIQEQQG